MKNAIILHGRPDKSEYYIRKLIYRPNSRAHWLGWLSDELRNNGFEVVAPEIPKAFEPQWDIWERQVDKRIIGTNTLLIGHSTGAGFWLRYLSDNPKLKVGKIILIAPWLDPNRKLKTDFFNFELDKNLASRTKSLVVFYSDNDMRSVNQTVQKLKTQLNSARFSEFHHAHFTYADMRTKHFPELLDECLKSDG